MAKEKEPQLFKYNKVVYRIDLFFGDDPTPTKFTFDDRDPILPRLGEHVLSEEQLFLVSSIIHSFQFEKTNGIHIHNIAIGTITTQKEDA